MTDEEDLNPEGGFALSDEFLDLRNGHRYLTKAELCDVRKEGWTEKAKTNVKGPLKGILRATPPVKVYSYRKEDWPSDEEDLDFKEKEGPAEIAISGSESRPVLGSYVDPKIPCKADIALDEDEDEGRQTMTTIMTPTSTPTEILATLSRKGPAQQHRMRPPLLRHSQQGPTSILPSPPHNSHRSDYRLSGLFNPLKPDDDAAVQEGDHDVEMGNLEEEQIVEEMLIDTDDHRV